VEKPIRVLLVEDETIVGEAICALLADEEGIQIVGEAVSAEAAIRKARLLKPDVILLDLGLPDRPGIEVIPSVLQENPHAHILILTGCMDETEVAAAFRAGAMGYVLKTQAITDLVRAIEQAAQGQSLLHPRIARIMLSTLGQPSARLPVEQALSEAEMRVLRFVAEGLSNKEIARCLGVSRMTINVHVSSILAKLNLTNRTQAALYALRQGWVTLKAPRPGYEIGATAGALPLQRWGRGEAIRAA
jgi:two-component system, NarL family, response regulator LiaR